MKLELRNDDLEPVKDMLMTIETTPVQARAVSRFVKLIVEKYNEKEEDIVKIAKEMCEVDKNGNLVPDFDGNVIPKEGFTIGKIIHEQNLIREELAVLDLTEFEPRINDLVSALNGTETKMSGVTAMSYDLLLTKIEEVTTQ